MKDDLDPIIDSLLEEALGGKTPPDLRARILGARDAATDTWVDVEFGKSPPKNGGKASASKALPQVVPVAPISEITAAKRGRRRRTLRFFASAAVITIGASLFMAWSLDLKNQIVEFNQSPPATISPDRDAVVKVDLPDLDDGQSAVPKSRQPVPEDPAPTDVPDIGSDLALADAQASQSEGIQFTSRPFVRTVDIDEPSGDQRVVSFVNRQLKESWEQKNILPLPSVNDLVWFRRASRYLLGRLPNKQEAQQFGRSRDRENAINAMLASDDFANYWGNVVTRVLIGNGTQQQIQRQQLQDYIVRSIREGKPYDELSFELIAAVGSNDPDSPHFNPATNFLLSHLAVDTVAGKRAPEIRVAATDKVCQVFLGKQLQCARCHDHHDTSQEQYYQVASFFAQMRPHTASHKSQQLVNGDFAGSSGTPDDADLYFVDSQGIGVSVSPTFLDGQTPAIKSGKVQDIDRRAELAQMIVSSDDFSRATVNRLWKHAVGSGFTRPVDDMGNHNKPTHPKLLARLATEFKNSKYDIKVALRWITMSAAFDRALSRTDGQFDSFASFARRDNLMFPAIDQGLRRIAKARSADEFGQLLAQEGAGGKSLSPERKEREMQRISGRLKEKLLRNSDGSLLAHLINNDRLTDSQRLSHFFWATVGRAPTRREEIQGLQMLAHGSKTTAMQDIGWILLNSEEFVAEH